MMVIRTLPLRSHAGLLGFDSTTNLSFQYAMFHAARIVADAGYPTIQALRRHSRGNGKKCSQGDCRGSPERMLGPDELPPFPPRHGSRMAVKRVGDFGNAASIN
jgi:hypothetical protein